MCGCGWVRLILTLRRGTARGREPLGRAASGIAKAREKGTEDSEGGIHSLLPNLVSSSWGSLQGTRKLSVLFLFPLWAVTPLHCFLQVSLPGPWSSPGTEARAWGLLNPNVIGAPWTFSRLYAGSHVLRRPMSNSFNAVNDSQTIEV